MTISKESDTIQHVAFADGRRLTVVGSAHISSRSVEEVREQMVAVNPDSVCIELDEDRWSKFCHKDDELKDFDLIRVIRQGKFFLVMANAILASFQRRMSLAAAGEAGREMLSAGEVALERGLPLCLADRNISLTLKRAWAKSTMRSRCMILATLFASLFDRSEITEEELDRLKEQSNIDRMLYDMASQLPAVKSVLIDERDEYLALKIYSAVGDNKLAVIGQGHMKGVLSALERLEKSGGDTEGLKSRLEKIPKRGGVKAFKDWLVPSLICLALFGVGVVKGWKMGVRYFAAWAILNAFSAGVGAVLSLAHPLTAVASIAAAPISALTPVLGVGMIAALVQASVKRSRVEDLNRLSDDMVSLRGWFVNRILHTFLIFISTTLFSALGTFVVFPSFRSLFFRAFGWD